MLFSRLYLSDQKASLGELCSCCAALVQHSAVAVRVAQRRSPNVSRLAAVRSGKAVARSGNDRMARNVKMCTGKVLALQMVTRCLPSSACAKNDILQVVFDDLFRFLSYLGSVFSLWAGCLDMQGGKSLHQECTNRLQHSPLASLPFSIH